MRAQNQLNAKYQAVDNSFTTLQNHFKTRRSTVKVTALIQQPTTAWHRIKFQVIETDRNKAYSGHTKVLAALNGILQEVLDYSSLILDPQIDSYFMMDLVGISLAKLIENLTNLSSMFF